MRAEPRSVRRQRGVAAVELALLMPVLLLIFFGIAGLGRVYVVDLALAHAARAGMQYALASNTRDVALIAAAARRDALSDLPGMPLPAVAIVLRCADGSPYGGSGPCAGAASAPWTYVEVHASYQLGAAFVPLLPVFSQPLRLRQSAVARLQ